MFELKSFTLLLIEIGGELCCDRTGTDRFWDGKVIECRMERKIVYSRAFVHFDERI